MVLVSSFPWELVKGRPLRSFVSCPGLRNSQVRPYGRSVRRPRSTSVSAAELVYSEETSVAWGWLL